MKKYVPSFGNRVNDVQTVTQCAQKPFGRPTPLIICLNLVFKDEFKYYHVCIDFVLSGGVPQ